MNKINLILSFRVLILLLMLVQLSFTARSQVSIYPIQDFNFGTFYQGNAGGAVEISNTGSRTASGDIVLINSASSSWQAIFEIDAPEGSVISILKGSDIILNGSKGGSIKLQLGDSDPSSPFITTAAPPARTVIGIGGTLIIGAPASSPPGDYSGSFSITFHQE